MVFPAQASSTSDAWLQENRTGFQPWRRVDSFQPLKNVETKLRAGTTIGIKFYSLHGRKSSKTVPETTTDWRDLTFRTPWCRSIISRLIHSPKPVPLLPFVVKKGSKMWERVEGVIPEPVSAIVRMIPFPPVAHSVPSLLRMNRWPPFGIMASIAFPTRLLSTCRISPSRHVT
jgi:hypothetical protein